MTTGLVAARAGMVPSRSETSEGEAEDERLAGSARAVPAGKLTELIYLVNLSHQRVKYRYPINQTKTTKKRNLPINSIALKKIDFSINVD